MKVLPVPVAMVRAEEPTGGDDFTTNPAVFNGAPSCGFEGGVDEFGAGFGFVHGAIDSVCWEVGMGLL